MNLTKTKKKIITKLSAIATFVTMIAINANISYATGAIGTQEVQTATDNIKRVITSIAMPLRWSFNIRKYSNCSNTNDSKCK